MTKERATKEQSQRLTLGPVAPTKNIRKEAATRYISYGWHVFPCKPRGKKPLTAHGFKDASLEAVKIAEWWKPHPDANVAIRTGETSNLMILDIDGPEGESSLKSLEEKFGRLPPTVEATTPNGRHLYFEYPGGDIRCSAGKIAIGLDVRANGGYVVAPPSVHPSGQEYTWKQNHGPEGIPTAALPDWLMNLTTRKNSPEPHEQTGRHQNGQIPTHQRNNTLASLAGAMRRRGMSEPDILAALLKENADKCEEPLGVEEVEQIARSISRYEPAEKKYPRTDLGNAELFADLNADTLCHDHGRAEWLTWSGHWWESDKSDSVIQRAKACARYRYEHASSIEDLDERKREAQWAIASESRSRIDSMLKLARSEPTIAVPKSTQWNSNSMLLGVKNGVVDLHSGRLLPGKQFDLISNHTSVAYNPKAKCPRWLIFFSEILDKNAELIRYLWKALGYSLTGQTVEQIIFLLYGTGANGKSLLLKVLNQILGSYSYVAPFSVFDQRRGSQSNDLAALVGKRLVIASETRENTTLDEARIKLLTGGDPITARFLYHENFTYVPQLKPWLALNHLPRVTDQSHAFWRRVRLIPFDVRFEGPEDDKNLAQKLLAEKEAILAWLIEGAVLFQNEGLDPPDIVLAATQEYQARSDPLTQFIADCCVVGPGQKVGANGLYDRYKAWALYQGATREETLGSRSFGENMSMRFRKKREARGKYYDKIGLKKVKP